MPSCLQLLWLWLRLLGQGYFVSQRIQPLPVCQPCSHLQLV
jgi:hypothetical protein